MAWKTGTEVNEDMGNGVSGGEPRKELSCFKENEVWLLRCEVKARVSRQMACCVELLLLFIGLVTYDSCLFKQSFEIYTLDSVLLIREKGKGKREKGKGKREKGKGKREKGKGKREKGKGKRGIGRVCSKTEI
jgi:hypothetical protein